MVGLLANHEHGCRMSRFHTPYRAYIHHAYFRKTSHHNLPWNDLIGCSCVVGRRKVLRWTSTGKLFSQTTADPIIVQDREIKTTRGVKNYTQYTTKKITTPKYCAGGCYLSILILVARVRQILVVIAQHLLTPRTPRPPPLWMLVVVHRRQRRVVRSRRRWGGLTWEWCGTWKIGSVRGSGERGIKDFLHLFGIDVDP